jgi:hypothetical protein
MSEDKEKQGRRRAAVFLITAWVLGLHPWVPALLVAGFVAWVVLHKRLEGELGASLTRGWRRAWPPGAFVLIPLLLASAIVFWLWDVPIMAKVLPIALSLLGLSTVLLGTVRRSFARPERFAPASEAPQHVLD